MAQDAHLLKGTGWSAVSHDLASTGPPHGAKHAADHEEDDSAPSSPVAGSAPPPDLVAAFLQSHRSNAAAAAGGTAPAAAAAAEGKAPLVLRSSSINSDADGDVLLLPNPFANNYPQIPSSQQQQQQQQHGGVKGAVAHPLQQQQQQQQQRKKRSLLQRLFRGLMVTTASAGLMALGAWGGSLAYRHYMAQLDDRDQLARRVADLQKQEERLVLRCTALEQDRQNLAAQLSDASNALSNSAAARNRLQQQLAQATIDKEETVRLNLNLQRKLTSLEEQHASLSATQKDKLQALDAALVEAARLDKEVTKLLGTVEKLESRCGALEAANVELKREAAALLGATQKNKTQKC